MATELRDGTTVEDPRLDRIAVDNPRALEMYPISALFEEPIPLVNNEWPIGPRLDQGREGACVGFGWTAELLSEPVPVAGAGQETARPLYYELQRRDEFPGGEYPGAYPRQGGTSVEAGAKLLTEVGHYREYRWGRTEEDMARAVGHVGPVVIGVNWYEGMRNPDRNGFIKVTGRVMGGHCVMVYGVNVTDPMPLYPDTPVRPAPRRTTGPVGYYSIQNSWGEKWGRIGTCYISRKDMARLLRERGDVCLPVRTDLAQYNGPTAWAGPHQGRKPHLSP